MFIAAESRSEAGGMSRATADLPCWFSGTQVGAVLDLRGDVKLCGGPQPITAERGPGPTVSGSLTAEHTRLAVLNSPPLHIWKFCLVQDGFYQPHV